MRLVEIIKHPTAAERRTAIEFVEQVAASTGARPLSDHLWLDLTVGDGDGFVAIRLADETGSVAYAQVSAANESSALEVIVDPRAADRRALRDDAVETAVDAVRRAGGGALTWWIDDPGPDDLEFARNVGLHPGRQLYEMRRPLPLRDHATVETRSFVPGVDDDAWLEVNNRAFATHGEQGGWTQQTLAARLAEPWFDPDGFRLHEREGRLAAFCWTKLHHDQNPVVGEIYVIAVDPDFHGLGLGRQLTLAGLDSISARDITEANLWVDADNTPAVSLYEQLGFRIHRTRQACSGVLTP